MLNNISVMPFYVYRMFVRRIPKPSLELPQTRRQAVTLRRLFVTQTGRQAVTLRRYSACSYCKHEGKQLCLTAFP